MAWGLRLSRVTGPTRQPTIGVGQWLLALPAVALLAPLVYLLCVIFGLGTLALTSVLVVALLLGLLVPVVLPVLSWPSGPNRRPLTSWALPGLAFVAMLAALGVGHLTRQPTADQPQQTQLFYMLDATRHQAYWVSSAAQPDNWTSRVFTQPSYQPLPTLFPGARRPVLHQAAPVLALAPPTLTVLADEQVAASRRLRLQLVPARAGVSSLLLSIASPTPLQNLRVAGHRVPAAALAPVAGAVRLTFFCTQGGGGDSRLGSHGWKAAAASSYHA